MNQLIHRLPVWSSLSVIVGMLFIGYVLPWISIAGVPVFRSIWVRIALGLVLLALVAFVHWYKKRKENQREQALINDMGQVSAGELTPDSEFNRIFSEVFTALNMEKDGKKRLYEIPWYLVIGSPGSGKTTLLRKSGLDFIGSKEALEGKGIAGTVLCDWWVSSEIVLLDTAGRLTSHDHQEKDASDWSSLLSKLYKYRPIQPLNGIILTLSVDTLMSSEKCDKFIQLAIKRLDDVQKTLNVRLPVYLFITKTDLLPGFDACFHQFESKERRRLWGFPFDQSNNNFKELLQRLKIWVYSKQSELRQDEAQQVLIFYQHFIELTHSISNFTTYLAAELKYDIKLRSVFFTSGTQNGNPVEKIFSQVLSSQYGYSLSDVSLRQYPKAYFIQTAFSDVIYKESGYAGHAIEYLKKKRLQLILVSSLCFSLLIGMNVYWWHDANKVKITAEEFQDKFDLIAYETRKLSTIKGSIGFFKDVDSLLEEYSENNFNTLFIDGDISEALYNAKKGVYISTLIPFMINKIRASMLNTSVRQVVLYEQLKAYIMLSTGRFFDEKFLLSWLKNNPNFAKSSDLSEEENKLLYYHMERAIVTPNEKGFNIDQHVILVARKKLEYFSIEKRLLQALGTKKGIPEWDEKLIRYSASMDDLFVRSDGLSLSALPSSLYSQKGMLWLLQQDVEKMTEVYMREGWVLSDSNQLITKSNGSDSKAIVNTMMLDYIVNYIKVWMSYFDSIRLKLENDKTRLVAQLDQLSDSESDFSLWLSSAISQLHIAKEIKEDKTKSWFVKLAENNFNRNFSDITIWASLDKKTTGVIRLNQKLSKIKDLLEKQIIEPSSELKSNIAINNQFQILIAELPSPINLWFGYLSSQADTAMKEMADIALNVAWKEKISVCKERTSGRYPFSRKSKLDMSLNDFTKIFGQSGLFNTFYNYHPSATNKLNEISSFSLSKKISSSYFIAGDNPGFDFSIRLKSVSPVVSKVYINVGNDSLVYEQADGKWLHARWPLHSGTSEVKIKLVDEFDFTIWERGYYGLWALHKMSESLSARPLRNGNFLIKKGGAGWFFSLELQVPEKNNLLLLNDFRRFRCPEEL